MSDNNTQEFASVFLQHRKGAAHDEASAKLREAVAAVKEQGKSATLTITLKIEPVKNNSRVVQIEDKVTAKIPEPPRSASIFFADDNGGLHRNDPTQREFDYTEPADNKSAAAGRD